MPSIIHLEEKDSTNTYLKDLLLRQEVEEGTIVIADFQTGGKGQRGNSWESNKGENLLFSIVLYPNTIKANEQFIISQVVSLAIADFLKKFVDDITIKWPNDIYWQEKKICGILIENSLTENNINESVIGIGVNINQTIFFSDAPNPVSLKQITGEEYHLKTLLEEIRDTILLYYKQAVSENRAAIISHYKASLFRKDGYHLYNDGEKDFSARIKDIEPNGLLVLETDEGIERKFAFKEIKYKI